MSEVPVEYQTVQSLVPSLWKQYRPLVRGERDMTYPNLFQFNAEILILLPHVPCLCKGFEGYNCIFL